MYGTRPLGELMARLDSTAFLFLDTNIFLEIAYHNIDWLTATNYKHVILILAPKVIEEMDEHKRDSNSERRRERARVFSSFLGRLTFPDDSMTTSMPNKNNVEIRALLNSPNLEEYAGLTWSNSDDQILASILDFKTTNPHFEEHTFIVSEDNSMRLKAQIRKIKVLWNEHIESQRLPPETSPQTKQIRLLEQKIEELSKRISAQEPKLSLKLLNNHDKAFTDIILSTPTILFSDEAIESEVEKEKKELEAEFGTSIFEVADWTAPTAEDRNRYYSELRRFMHQVNQYKTTNARIFEMKIELSNSVATADDILVILKIDIETADFLAERSKLPQRPKRPRREVVYLFNDLPNLSRDFSQSADEFNVKENKVEWRVHKLLHNREEISPSFYVNIVDFTYPLKIFYEIHASNQDKFIGELIEVEIKTK